MLHPYHICPLYVRLERRCLGHLEEWQKEPYKPRSSFMVGHGGDMRGTSESFSRHKIFVTSQHQSPGASFRSHKVH